MDHYNLKFRLESTDYQCPLSFTVKLDGETVWRQDPVAQPSDIVIPVPDTDSTVLRTLTLEMGNKLRQHTNVDESGTILQDACLQISNFAIDDICIDHPLQKNSRYQHNFNGHGDTTVTGFFGVMGCNGTVTFTFTTPIFYWLLDNC